MALAARPAACREAAATAVLPLDLREASVKVRQGPPGDPEEVAAGDRRWTGVVPISTVLGTPEAWPALPDEVEVPEHVRALSGRRPAAR